MAEPSRFSSLDPRVDVALPPAPACPAWCTDDDLEHRGGWDLLVSDRGNILGIDKSCGTLIVQVTASAFDERAYVDVSVERMATCSELVVDDVTWVGVDGSVLTADEAERLAGALLEAVRVVRGVTS